MFRLKNQLTCLSILLIWLWGSLCLGAHVNETDKDVLFASWMTNYTNHPLLAYEVEDFVVSHGSVMSLIKTNQPGVVVFKEGKHELIKNSISQLRDEIPSDPLYACEIKRLFEIPINMPFDWPSHLQVVSVRDDSLAYQLGKAHGRVLTDIGFDLVKFNDLQELSALEDNKVALYLQGLNNAGIAFWLTGQSLSLSADIGWSSIYLVDSHLLPGAKKLSKIRSEYYKARGFNGLIVEEYLPYHNVSNKINQLVDGAGIMLCKPGDSKTALDWMDSEIKTKGFFKQSVRRYYEIRRAIRYDRVSETTDLEIELLVSRINNESFALIADRQRLIPLGSIDGEFVLTLSNNLEARWMGWMDRQVQAIHEDILLLKRLNADSISQMLPEETLIVVEMSGVLDQMEFDSYLVDLQELDKRHRVILLVYGELNYFDRLLGFDHVLWSPVDNVSSRIELLKVLFGIRGVSGVVPGYLVNGQLLGEVRQPNGRIDFLLPNYVFEVMESKIDSIVCQAIKNQEMPGCQIMMLKEGVVVFDKNYGFHTYDSLQKVEWDDLYDIASVTKTTATLPAMMREVSLGRISLQDTLGKYLEVFARTNKGPLQLDKILAHQSGLLSYHPFWRDAGFDSLSRSYYYKNEVEKYQPMSADMRIDWKDSINAWIARSRFNQRANADGTFGYLYSDIGFMLIQQVLEKSGGKGLDEYTKEYFYRPLGMSHTMYNPSDTDYFETVPTEQDGVLRNKLLDGEVHDRNAILLGGVSGHAGLFSNATDLAKYMQMMLNGGNYADIKYFDTDLVSTFTSKPGFSDRRGLGWDKPAQSISNCSQYASDESFGHSGFTGTLVWADPKYDLIYIFLSNRVYPDAQNYKLIHNKTRTKIHDIMYEAILAMDSRILIDQ